MSYFRAAASAPSSSPDGNGDHQQIAKTERPKAVGSRGQNQSTANIQRWSPTKEQTALLETLYAEGIRTPSALQIEHITNRLRLYGNIECKNVFYWFQNHKARQRQKQKQAIPQIFLPIPFPPAPPYIPHTNWACTSAAIASMNPSPQISAAEEYREGFGRMAKEDQKPSVFEQYLEFPDAKGAAPFVPGRRLQGRFRPSDLGTESSGETGCTRAEIVAAHQTEDDVLDSDRNKDGLRECKTLELFPLHPTDHVCRTT